MREQNPRLSAIGRRDFLAAGGTALALASAPRLAAGQAKRSGEITAGLSERMLTLDPANHYSISTTSVLRHLFDPLIDVTNDSKFVPALAEKAEHVTMLQRSPSYVVSLPNEDPLAKRIRAAERIQATARRVLGARLGYHHRAAAPAYFRRRSRKRRR